MIDTIVRQTDRIALTSFGIGVGAVLFPVFIVFANTFGAVVAAGLAVLCGVLYRTSYRRWRLCLAQVEIRMNRAIEQPRRLVDIRGRG